MGVWIRSWGSRVDHGAGCGVQIRSWDRVWGLDSITGAGVRVWI